MSNYVVCACKCWATYKVYAHEVSGWGPASGAPDERELACTECGASVVERDLGPLLPWKADT